MNADYIPYAGSVPQGSTFVHHAHVLAKYQKTWTFGAHYLYTWTPDDNWHPINSRLPNVSNSVPRARARSRAASRSSAPRCGSGRRARRRLRRVFARRRRNINALADRWSWSTRGAATTSSRTSSAALRRPLGQLPGPQNETGTIDNIALQYSFSFGALARYPESWWGDGPGSWC
jgi:hypothetical protein